MSPTGFAAQQRVEYHQNMKLENPDYQLSDADILELLDYAAILLDELNGMITGLGEQ